MADRLGSSSASRKPGRSVGLQFDWIAALIAFPLAGFLLFVVDVLVLQTFRVGNSAGFLLVITFLLFSLIMGRALSFLKPLLPPGYVCGAFDSNVLGGI